MNISVSKADAYLEALLRGDRRECSVIANAYLKDNNSLTQLYEEVLKKALYQIGILWETNKISVATEHMATAITEGVLNELYEQVYNPAKHRMKVVVACTENEQHQVGIKMVADTFELHGWDSFFLGTGIPTEELIRFVKEKKPQILAISLSIYFNYSRLIKMLSSITKEFPELEILIGGQAFNHIGKEIADQFNQIRVIDNLYDLNIYIQSLKK